MFSWFLACEDCAESGFRSLEAVEDAFANRPAEQFELRGTVEGVAATYSLPLRG